MIQTEDDGQKPEHTPLRWALDGALDEALDEA